MYLNVVGIWEMSRADLFSMNIAEYFMLMAQQMWINRDNDDYMNGKNIQGGASLADLQKMFSNKNLDKKVVLSDPV